MTRILFLILSSLFLLQQFLVDFISSQESQMSFIPNCLEVKTWPDGHNFLCFGLDCHSVIVREIDTVAIKAEGNEIMTIWSSLDLKAFGYEDHQTLLRRNKVHKKMLKKKLRTQKQMNLKVASVRPLGLVNMQTKSVVTLLHRLVENIVIHTASRHSRGSQPE